MISEIKESIDYLVRTFGTHAALSAFVEFLMARVEGAKTENAKLRAALQDRMESCTWEADCGAPPSTWNKGEESRVCRQCRRDSQLLQAEEEK